MLDRAYLESKPNWVATFERPNGEAICLMASTPGCFYWHIPDYEGVFAWGATASFTPGDLKDALQKQRLRLTTGTPP